MKKTLKILSATALCLITCAGSAAPESLTIVNNIDSESNAAIHGVLSPNSIAANSIWSDPWANVVATCDNTPTLGISNLCAVEVYAETNTKAPVDVGAVVINLDSGHMVAENRTCSGYEIKVLSHGTVMLTKAE